MNKKSSYRTIEECLVEWLQNPENMQEYLYTILEEYGNDRDLTDLLSALNILSIARGGRLKLCENLDVDRERLDKLLIENSAPTWESVIEALGYTFSSKKPSVPLEECLNEWLNERLQGPENVQLYFDVTIEEYLEDSDFDFFIDSLHTIATAKGGVLQFIENSEVDQGKLNSLLEKNSNPSWEQLLQGLGYSFV